MGGNFSLGHIDHADFGFLRGTSLPQGQEILVVACRSEAGRQAGGKCPGHLAGPVEFQRPDGFPSNNDGLSSHDTTEIEVVILPLVAPKAAAIAKAHTMDRVGVRRGKNNLAT